MGEQLETATILVVDDDVQYVEFLESLLKPRYKVMTATSGLKGIEIAKTAESIDLILLDVMMPEMDGYETSARLKEVVTCKDAPVIYISGLQNVEDRVKGFAAGAVDFLTKPLRIEEVLARVNTQIQLRRMQKQLQISHDLLEQKVKERTIDLEEALQYNELLLNSVGDGIYGLNVNGETTFINPAMRALLNYEPDETSGGATHELTPLPLQSDGVESPKSECGIHYLYGASVEQKPGQKPGQSSATDIYRKKDVSSVSAEHTTTPIYKNNKLQGKVVTLRDVNDKNFDRSKASEAKQKLVSTVSHELRTPLTVIIASLELVAGGVAGEVPKSVMEMINLAKTNSENLNFLINKLLDVGKTEYGKLRINLKPVTVNEVVQRAIETNIEFASKYNVEVAWEPYETDLFIGGDIDRLVQGLLNLFSNAIKYSFKNGKVEVGVRVVDEYAQIYVKDYGLGIPKEFQGQVFERYTQADSSIKRSVGGTGLGLAITREIIHEHNGYVDFESIEGQGATFYVCLPLI